jgi:hypothetical protein
MKVNRIKLEKLIVFNKNLTSLKGIKNLKNLKEL